MLAACTQWLESVTQATQISTDFQMQRKLKRDALSLLSWWTKTMVTHHVWVRFFGISVESLSWIVLFQSTEIQSIFFGLNLRNKLISPKLIFSTFSFFGRDFKRTSRLLLDCSDDDNVRFFNVERNFWIFSVSGKMWDEVCRYLHFAMNICTHYIWCPVQRFQLTLPVSHIWIVAVVLSWWIYFCGDICCGSSVGLFPSCFLLICLFR